MAETMERKANDVDENEWLFHMLAMSIEKHNDMHVHFAVKCPFFIQLTLKIFFSDLQNFTGRPNFNKLAIYNC